MKQYPDVISLKDLPGLKVGVRFRWDDETVCYMSDDGCHCYDSTVVADNQDWFAEVSEFRKPEKDEKYWFPDSSDPKHPVEYNWCEHHPWEYSRLNSGQVYSIKEDAIECGKRMNATAKAHAKEVAEREI